MKKTALTIVAVLLLHIAFTQANNSKTFTLDSISKLVIHYLQAKQSDSIYALAGEKFRSQLKKEDFKTISETQVFPLNDFQHITFIGNENGINKYKVAGTPDLQLLIGLDAANKLETLLIKTFSDN